MGQAIDTVRADRRTLPVWLPTFGAMPHGSKRLVQIRGVNSALTSSRILLNTTRID